jgi:GH24 family phage-related lysozyme (muramidase)
MSTIPSPTTNQISVSHTALRGLDPGVVSPNTFGAQIGGAMQGFAQDLAQAGERWKRDQESIANVNAINVATDAEVQLREAQIQRQRNTPPDSANYFQIAEPEIDNMVNKVLSDQDPEVSKKLEPHLRELANKYKMQELDYHFQSTDNYYKTNIQKTATDANNLFNAGSMTQEEASARVTAAIQASNLPPQEKIDAKMKYELHLQSLSYAKATRSDITAVTTDAGGAIEKFESLQTTAYEDHKTSDGSSAGYRIGYGSDKVVMSDGSIVPVTSGMVITKEDADRTLKYRLDNEFSPRVQQQVGPEQWAALPKNAQAGLLSVAWNYGELPDSVVSAVGTHDVGQIAQAVAALPDNPERRQQEASIIADSRAGYRANDYGNIPVSKNADGYWSAPNVTYQLDGKIRDLPVSAKTIQMVSGVAASIDPSLGITVVSGGQDPHGKHTGSSRHNVDSKTGEANTLDIVLTRNGKAILPSQDKALYAAFFEKAAAAGFTGVGSYPWGIHVGGGKLAFWGPSTGSGDADPEFKAAWERGLAQRTGGIDADPRFQDLPAENRIAIGKQVQGEVEQERSAALSAETKAHTEAFNQFMFDVGAGKYGPADIQTARDNGVIKSWSEMNQAQEVYNQRQKQANYAMNGQNMVANGMVADPQNDDDKKALDAFAKQTGVIDGLRNLDAKSVPLFTTIAQKTGMMPPEAQNLLNAMALSTDWKTAKFALDTLAAVNAATPNAMRVMSADETARLKLYTDSAAINTAEETQRLVQGPSTPEDRQREKVFREEAPTQFLKTYPDRDSVIDMMTKHQIWGPSTNLDSTTTQLLYSDFRAKFIDFYGRTGNQVRAENAAAEFMKKVWGESDVGGTNVLMRYPPDKAGYPMVNGSYSYMESQVRHALPVYPGKSFELRGDGQTATEIALFQAGQLKDKEGKPRYPTYKVITEDPYGNQKVLEGRFAAEITPDMHAENRQYQADQQTMQEKSHRFDELSQMRDMHARLGDTMPPAEAEEFEALRKDLFKDQAADSTPVLQQQLKNLYDGTTMNRTFGETERQSEIKRIENILRRR